MTHRTIWFESGVRVAWIACSLAITLTPLSSASAEDKAPSEIAPSTGQSAQGGTELKLSPEAEAALKRLEMPGVAINIEERSVDIVSTVCLHDGLLELIACTKDTKEHESIVAIDAKPRHVHTALLLLGAKNGNPAMQKLVDKEGTRWVDIPPRGGEVGVFLVFKNKEGKEIERPISDFIAPAEDPEADAGVEEESKFPTHIFLFAGSRLHGEGPGPKTYLSDLSGNVITLATFGDEVLCLPGVHSHAKGTLMWQVDPKDLPAVGSKVTLRLRPQFRPDPIPDAEKSGR